MNNISVTDNRTITVIINGTEHKLAIKEAEVLRDALVRALPTAVRVHGSGLEDMLKQAKREYVNAPSLVPKSPGMPYKPNEVWCRVDYPIFQ